MRSHIHQQHYFMIYTTPGHVKSRQVILNFSSCKNQCKKYCLIFGFFFNGVVELYKIPKWFPFPGRAPHLYNPQRLCLSVAVPLCNSSFRDVMTFEEFKGRRIQLPCNISTEQSKWGVCRKCVQTGGTQVLLHFYIQTKILKKNSWI